MNPPADPLRLFVAVPCVASPGLRRVIESLAALGPSVKPVDPAHLHLTLRFLGDTPRRRLEALKAGLERAIRAAAVGPIDVQWAELGRFPAGDRRRARVVFATPENATPFEQLAAAVNDQFAALSPPFPPADRTFTAHLTLARIKPPLRDRRSDDPTAAIDQICQHTQAHNLGDDHIESAQLIASALTPRGPVYTVQHAVKL